MGETIIFATGKPVSEFNLHECLVTSVFSCFHLFATLWSKGHQASLFMGKNTGMGCHFLLQRLFLTQGLNPCLFCLPNWQVGSLSLVPPGEIQQADSPNAPAFQQTPPTPMFLPLEKAGVRYLIFKFISLSR